MFSVVTILEKNIPLFKCHYCKAQLEFALAYLEKN